jgi:hypothetical protein
MKFWCPTPRWPLLHDPANKTDVIQRVRCARWTCRPCAAYFRDRLKTSIGHHMTDPARPVEWVYVCTIPAEAWPTIHKSISRYRKTHGKRYGQFAKLSPDGGTREFEVYTTAAVFKHAEKLTPEQAKDRFGGRIDLCVGFNPRVSTSRGWKMPRERDDTKRDLKCIGEVCPHLKHEQLERYATVIGSSIEMSSSANSRPGWVQSTRTMPYPKWFNAHQIEYSHWTLRSGMTPDGVDIDDVTGPPPAEESPIPEDIFGWGKRSGEPPGTELDLGAYV